MIPGFLDRDLLQEYDDIYANLDLKKECFIGP